MSKHLCAALVYDDPWQAIEFLVDAFGFERRLIVSDEHGKLAHSELSFGASRLMVGGVWSDLTATPRTTDGKNTQTVHVQLEHDIDAHCEHARQGGARIVQEPADQFYGDRTYRAVDPQGHLWSFAQTVNDVDYADLDASSGLKIQVWD